MKIIVIIGIGRAGIELLQSLFDNHSQILQMPGIIRFDKKFKNTLKFNSLLFINTFIKNNKHFFDSRLQKLERHNQLGFNKKQYYLVSKNIFKKKFLAFYKKKNHNEIDKIISIHKAYASASNISLSKKKVLVLNIHALNYFKNFNNIFKNYKKIEIILMIRDPLSSLYSTINNWLNYKKGKYLTTRSLFLNIDMHINMINYLINFKRNINIIKLEELHKNSKVILKNICKKFSIRYEKSLEFSTFFNKKWWGDSISKKYLDGLNPNFTNSFNKEYFYEKDINIIEKKISNIIKKYNYKFKSKREFNFLYNILPFKFELIVWINCVKNKNYKEVLLIPFYYIKRIFLIFFTVQKKSNLLPKIIK